MLPQKEGEAEQNLLIASPLTEPQDMQPFHAVLSAWEGLGQMRGEPLPCPHFAHLQGIPTSCNLIVSFVSIIVSDHQFFCRERGKACPTSQRGNENDF